MIRSPTSEVWEKRGTTIAEREPPDPGLDGPWMKDVGGGDEPPDLSARMQGPGEGASAVNWRPIGDAEPPDPGRDVEAGVPIDEAEPPDPGRKTGVYIETLHPVAVESEGVVMANSPACKTRVERDEQPMAFGRAEQEPEKVEEMSTRRSARAEICRSGNGVETKLVASMSMTPGIRWELGMTNVPDRGPRPGKGLDPGDRDKMHGTVRHEGDVFDKNDPPCELTTTWPGQDNEWEKKMRTTASGGKPPGRPIVKAGRSGD